MCQRWREELVDIETQVLSVTQATAGLSVSRKRLLMLLNDHLAYLRRHVRPHALRLSNFYKAVNASPQLARLLVLCYNHFINSNYHNTGQEK